ncbi:hypothetical protein RQP46_009043 [Phenoliferia psychrophenolica]
MRFPPEVVSLIVEQVRLAIRSDREAIGHPRIGGAVSAATLACALVSRDWADGSIPHLYFPNLEFDFSYANYQSLIVALERNAWCLPLVRRVEARLLDADEAESQWVARRCEAREAELRSEWETMSEWLKLRLKPYDQWLEDEVREDWMIAEDEGSPETLWCTTEQGVEDECAAFYALLGLFPNLEHLGVTGFPHGPSRPLALAASPTDAVLANLKSLAILDQPILKNSVDNTTKLWEQLLSATPALELLHLPGLNWRAEDQSNRKTWDDGPFDRRIFVALRNSSLRHFIINEPPSRKLVQSLPPTLETLEYRIRTREPDDLDTMTDWVLKRQMPKLRRIAYQTSKETWTRYGPGMAQEVSATAPQGGVDEEQRRADARVARAASVGIVLEVPVIAL